ncbi:MULTISPECIES: hypothetical protein [Methylopila]|uniref:Uncharacterized protein n=2 Tax=Methylopila TaxID=61653 RepID=A0A9W6N4P2_9HYPH|nr:hypothetical protein [Methylopila turkensis]GLK78339.1 hypothetical protein GCM10008174_00800 [Methylopila turkensis]
MKDPAVARVAGAVVFSTLLVALAFEGERAAQPVKAAEEVVAMIRDAADR